jgi:hypothetical protein
MTIDLRIAPETLGVVITRAMALGAENRRRAGAPLPADDDATDREVEWLCGTDADRFLILEDRTHVLDRTLAALHDDHIADLVALVWLGEGTFGREDWTIALMSARSLDADAARAHLMRTCGLDEVLQAGLQELRPPGPCAQALAAAA